MALLSMKYRNWQGHCGDFLKFWHFFSVNHVFGLSFSFLLKKQSLKNTWTIPIFHTTPASRLRRRKNFNPWRVRPLSFFHPSHERRCFKYKPFQSFTFLHLNSIPTKQKHTVGPQMKKKANPMFNKDQQNSRTREWNSTKFKFFMVSPKVEVFQDVWEPWVKVQILKISGKISPSFKIIELGNYWSADVTFNTCWILNIKLNYQITSQSVKTTREMRRRMQIGFVHHCCHKIPTNK